MSTTESLLCLALLFPLACGDDDPAGGLQPEDVGSIPAGNAVGTDASGTYDIEAYTFACGGVCRAGEGWLSFTVCDVGDRDDEHLDVVQEDGHLQVDGDDGLFVSRLEGGLHGDGSFDVGGYGTEAGGSVEATGRMTGDLDGDDVSGVFELWVRGNVDGDPLDCRASYDVKGHKVAPAHDDD
jgi:hypothetical protein